MTSTERDSRNSKARPAQSLFESLARTNRFSREDLEINHEGKLSHRQRKRLVLKALGFAAMFLGSVALVAIPFAARLPEQTWRSIVFYGFVFLLFLLSFGWQSISIFIDLWNGQVVSVQGSVVRVGERSRSGLAYYYQEGNLRFSVSKAAYDALIPQLHYRIFYAPYSCQLVSIEPVHPARQRK